jgi:hypothetical protein
MDWQTILYDLDWNECSKERRIRIVKLLKARFNTDYVRKTCEGALIPAPIMKSGHIRNALNYSLKCANSAATKRDWQHFMFRCQDISYLLREVVSRGFSIQPGKYDVLMLHYSQLNSRLPFLIAHKNCSWCGKSSQYYIPFHEYESRDMDSGETTYIMRCPNCLQDNWYEIHGHIGGVYETWNGETIKSSAFNIPDKHIY